MGYHVDHQSGAAVKVKPMPVQVLSVISSVLSLYCPELTPSVLVAALQEYPRKAERDPKACRGVSREEFCKMWSLSLSTVGRMIKAGTIPAYKIGRLWRIPLDAIESAAGKMQQPGEAGGK
jgi:excisionase family DNA binding protein